MEKLYCFQYDINENAVFQMEHDARPHKDMYIITVGDEPHEEDLFIWKADVLNETAKVYNDEDGKMLYLYSKTDDVNHALDIFEKYIKKSLDEKRTSVQKLESLYQTFLAKKQEIKQKYPTGKKS